MASPAAAGLLLRRVAERSRVGLWWLCAFLDALNGCRRERKRGALGDGEVCKERATPMFDLARMLEQWGL